MSLKIARANFSVARNSGRQSESKSKQDLLETGARLGLSVSCSSFWTGCLLLSLFLSLFGNISQSTKLRGFNFSFWRHCCGIISTSMDTLTNSQSLRGKPCQIQFVSFIATLFHRLLASNLYMWPSNALRMHHQHLLSEKSRDAGVYKLDLISLTWKLKQLLNSKAFVLGKSTVRKAHWEQSLCAC